MRSPLNRTFLHRTTTYEQLLALGDDTAAADYSRRENMMSLDYPAQRHTNSMLVDLKFRGQHVGSTLVRLGTAIAKINGAEERYFWTDATGQEGKDSYYLRFGAKTRAVSFGGNTKVVPVWELK